MTSAEEHAWLHDHVERLRAQIERLTARAVRTRGPRVCRKCGEGRIDPAKEASDAADRLERRVSRLLRAAAHLDNQQKAVAQRARRLAKSKAPADQAELVLGAMDELPVDLALQVAEEALRRARARAGDVS